MEQNSINKKITRRLFNGIIAIGSIFGLHKKVKANQFDKAIKEELKNTNYMEILIIPEEYRHPYSDKIQKVIANHLKAGKSKYEIKQFIISKCKIIKVPIK